MSLYLWKAIEGEVDEVFIINRRQIRMVTREMMRESVHVYAEPKIATFTYDGVYSGYGRGNRL